MVWDCRRAKASIPRMLRLASRSYVTLALCGAVSVCVASSCSSGGSASGAAGAEAGEAGALGSAGESASGASSGASGAPDSGGSAGKSGGNSSGGDVSGGSAGVAGGALGDAGTAGESGAPNMAPQSLSEADFPGTVAQLFCASNAHCCASGVATCVASETTDISGILAQAKTAGYVYDPAKAAQCALAIKALGESADCATAFMSTDLDLAPCLAVLDGPVAPGAMCSSPFDCHRGDAATTGGYAGCAPLGGADPRRCRSFVPARSVGDPCFDVAAAGPFGGMDGEVHLCSAGLKCVSGACAALPKAPEACPGGECADGQCTSGACVAFAQLNESCATATCKPSLSCVANKCTHPADSPWILDIGVSPTSYVCPQ
jgi:hypothetical protein